MVAVNSAWDFEEILAAAQEGDEDAIAELYARFSARLVAFLRTHVGQDSEDVASEVWISVAQSIRRFQGGESDFRSWLFTIARRRVSDWVRSSAKQVPVSLSDSEVTPSWTQGASEMVTDRLSAEETFARLAKLLPGEQSRVLILRVVGGLTTDEVARVVGKRPGAVRVLLYRALKNLASAADEVFEKFPGGA
jgi:RNA polymerase sigma-70 factor (ECF subfamily)